MALTEQARQQYKSYFDSTSSDEEKEELFEGIKIAHSEPNRHIHTKDELLSLSRKAREVSAADKVPTTDSDFMPGVKRGLQNLQATAYGAEALAGSGLKKVGLDSLGEVLQTHGIKGYKRNIEEAEKYPKKVSFKDIYTGKAGIGDTIDWAQGTLGELVPSMVEAALGAVAGAAVGSAAAPGPGTVAGGIGGLAGRTVLKKSIDKLVKEGLKKGIKGITEKELRRQVTKQALKKLGSKAGIAAAVLPMESGGMYADLFVEKGIDAPETALFFGSLATSLEFLGGNSRLVSTFIDSLTKGAKGLAKKSAKELLQNIPEEALQEGGQELLSILNTVANTDEELLTVENVERIVESMSAGAVGGSAGAGANVILSRESSSSTPDDPIEAQAKNIISNGPEVVQASMNKIDQKITDHNNLLNNQDSLAAMAVEENIPVDDVIKGVQTKIDAYSKLKERLTSSFTDEQQVGEETNQDIDSQVKKADVNLNPSEAQKEAGNYKKASVKVDDFNIKIENPAGSTRSGVDSDGEKWESKMNDHYGYFSNTEGRDGDQIDVFIKPGTTTSPRIYIVDQVNPKTGKFDEHKVVMGAESAEEAKNIYMENYDDGWQGFGSVTEMNQEEFKDWLGDDKRTKKPLYTKAKKITVKQVPNEENVFESEDGKFFLKYGDNWYDSKGHLVGNIELKQTEVKETPVEEKTIDLNKETIAKQSEVINELYKEYGIKDKNELVKTKKISPERKAEILMTVPDNLKGGPGEEAFIRSRAAYVKNTLGIDVGTDFKSDKPYLKPKPEVNAPNTISFSPKQLEALKGVTIKMPVSVSTKEGIEEIEIDAYEAYMENAEQQETIGKLLDCLAG